MYYFVISLFIYFAYLIFYFYFYFHFPRYFFVLVIGAIFIFDCTGAGCMYSTSFFSPLQLILCDATVALIDSAVAAAAAAAAATAASA